MTPRGLCAQVGSEAERAATSGTLDQAQSGILALVNSAQRTGTITGTQKNLIMEEWHSLKKGSAEFSASQVLPVFKASIAEILDIP